MSAPFDARQALPHTFGPWLARFPSLSPVQLQAIPLVLAGHDVLLTSPTATGKTEAYAVPLAERMIAARRPANGAFIISPTRALANDLHRRLKGPFERVGVPLGRWTGEHKERIEGEFPCVAITTPEALDSMLCRARERLRSVLSIVIDEVHVLDNGPRGDHLRILLHRLRLLVQDRIQVLAASATVEFPQALAERYLHNPQIVAVPGGRKMLVKPCWVQRAGNDATAPKPNSVEDRESVGASNPYAGEGAALAVQLDELARAGFRKVLIFCRGRNQVEGLSTFLSGKTLFREATFAHHGSMAKTARLRTERLFAQAAAGVCVATMTLEMGIDIGTIDYVVLATPPSDAASLLQRVGRGGRRGDATRVGILVRSSGELHLYHCLFRLGREGRLCEPSYAFRASVLAQQALVMAGALGWVNRASLARLLPPELDTILTESALDHVLSALAQSEHLETAKNGRFVLGEKGQRLWDRAEVHGNIDSEVTTDIVDRLTGQVIGHAEAQQPTRLGIGGRKRKVVAEVGGRILSDSSGRSSVARFKPRGAPSTTFALGRAVVESAPLGVQPGTITVLRDAGSAYWLHGLGSVGALLLSDLLGDSPAERHASPYIRPAPGKPPKDLKVEPQRLDCFLADHHHAVAKAGQPGPWFKMLPEAAQVSFARRCADLDRIAAFLNGVAFLELPEPSDDFLQIATTLPGQRSW